MQIFFLSLGEERVSKGKTHCFPFSRLFLDPFFNGIKKGMPARQGELKTCQRQKPFKKVSRKTNGASGTPPPTQYPSEYHMMRSPAYPIPRCSAISMTAKNRPVDTQIPRKFKSIDLILGNNLLGFSRKRYNKSPTNQLAKKINTFSA